LAKHDVDNRPKRADNLRGQRARSMARNGDIKDQRSN
jgi:hypothetical protein